MSSRIHSRGTRDGGVIGYPLERLHEEVAFLAYHFHWSHDELMSLEHADRRHWVEQYHEEAKTELGWDQYQGRRWDGFHRHAITVMLSYSFLVWLEGRVRQQRQVRGRPRSAFSPTPGPPEGAAATGPSPAE